MFAAKGALAPALPPAAYGDPAFFAREAARVFGVGVDGVRRFVPGAPVWHLAGTTFQLAKAGDYVSTDVVGVPVLVRNVGDRLAAFVNVCLHRQSVLELPGCGHRDELRCRYHGWEYDGDGKLAKLPDGPSFRGFKVGDRRLAALRVQTYGPLVFVTGSPAAPALREWLAPMADDLARFYERPLVPIGTRTFEADVNWKIVVENSVESYHVPSIHPGTFRDYRAEELHDHRITGEYTRYADLEPMTTTRSGRAAALLSRVLMRDADQARFRHAHFFPNLLFYFGELYCDVAVVMPLSATRMRHTSFAFAPDGLRSRALAPIRDLWSKTMWWYGGKVFREDGAAWRGVQAGVRAAGEAGVLSAREERVAAFQWYIALTVESE
jgi:phenylpropionate dioxygenase-like ring-hydroxylating dioxygenase large terminal subunit